MKTKKFILNTLLCLAIVSCTPDSSATFQSILETADMLPGLNKAPFGSLDLHATSHNFQYDRMVFEGSGHNAFLLEQALSEDATDYFIPGVTDTLTQGDMAIRLLLDINFSGTDNDWIEQFVPLSIQEEYTRQGAQVWWDWIQESAENRNWIIERIREVLITSGG